MNTTQQLTIKQNAVYLLRRLRPKFELPQDVNVYNQELAAMEKQLLNECSNFKPQSFMLDIMKEISIKWNEILETIGLNDDGITKSFDAAMFLYAQLVRARDLTDISLALAVYINTINTKSVTSIFRDAIASTFEACFAVSDTEMRPQSLEEFIDGFQEKLDFTASICDIPILKKMHKFLMYALSHSILDRVGLTFDFIGYTDLEAKAIAKAHANKWGMWHSLLDAMCTICKQIIVCVKTKSLSPLLTSSSAADTWLTQVYKLKRQERFISNPEPHGFNIFTFRSELDEAIEVGKSLTRFCGNATKFEKEKLKSLLSDLELIKANDITRKSSQRDRDSPFSILLAGGSSVGKSHLTNIMFQYFADLHDLPSGSEYKYTRNFTEEFWNGFTSSQWFIILDDIAALSPSLGVLDPSLAEVINVVNNVAFVPNQADLADKGKTPCLAKLVIATTNTPELNAFAYFSCPLAIRRRLPWVVNVVPKPEYARNKVMLDSSKCENDPGFFDDYWEITVSRVIPDGEDVKKQRGTLETHHVFSNINSFLSWFGRTSVTHFEQQAALAAAEKDMKSIKICKKCFYSTVLCVCATNICDTCKFTLSVCDCLKPQSGNISDYQTYLEMFGENLPTFWGHIYLFIANCVMVLPRMLMADQLNFPVNAYIFISTYSNYMFQGCYFSAYNWFAIWILYIIDWFYSCSVGIQFRITRFFLRGISHLVDQQIRIAREAIDKKLEPLKRYAKVFAVGVAVVGLGTLARNYYKKSQEKEDEVSKVEVDCSSVVSGCKTFAETKYDFWYHNSPRMAPAYGVSQSMIDEFWDSNSPSEVPAQEVLDSLPPIIEPVYPIMNPQARIEDECEVEESQPIATIGVTPVATIPEGENVWYKNTYDVSTFDVSTNTLSWKTFPIERVREILFRSVWRIRLKKPNMWTTTGMFAVSDTLYVLNRHALPTEDQFLTEIIRETDATGVTRNITTLINKTQIYMLPESDLAILNIRSLPPNKDLSGLLVKESFTGLYVGEYLKLSVDRVQTIIPVRHIQPSSATFSQHSTKVWKGVSQDLTVEGDCGSILYVPSPMGPVILGLHALGNLCHDVVATPLTSEMLDGARKHFKTWNLQCCSPDLTGEYASNFKVGPLNKKSPIRYITGGHAEVFGSLLGHRSNTRSRVQRTPLALAAENHGYSQKFFPPTMHGWLPWHNALNDMTKTSMTFRTDILDECVRGFTADILSRLTPEQLAGVKVYDAFTAVNGAAGVKFVDKMNRNTSMGFPWGKSKKHFLHSVPPRGDLQDPVDFDENFYARVQNIVDEYSKGNAVPPIFTAHLKDEPTKKKKVDSGATRVFGGAPADWSVVVRMYLLSVIKLMQENRFIFETAPGTNAQSKDWSNIYEFLVHHGIEKIIAGDFGKYDRTMPAIFILAAYDIIINVCKAANFTERELKILRCIAVVTAFPTYNFNGDWFRFFGSNPSGHPLTVLINGLANSLFMRYCYIILNPKHEVNTFKSYVHLMTYGDDNVMGVSSECPWFNHTAISTVLGAHGVIYTMADKEAKSVPYISINDVSFLKRGWLWCEELKAHLCPLDEESIEKSIMTCVQSKSVSQEYQAIQIVGTACMEYFFHGRSVFEDRVSRLKAIVHESNLDEYIEDSTFPTWEHLSTRFLETSHGEPWYDQCRLAVDKTELQNSQNKNSGMRECLKEIADLSGLVIREMSKTNC